MKKRKIIIPIVAVALIGCLTVSLMLYSNRDESKMAVFESREQFVEWLVAGDYGAAPSHFRSPLGGHPDLEADVSYLVPVIKEYGIPTFTCDDGELSYTGGYVTLSPHAESDILEPQLIFHLTLDGYEYTVYATYITEGVQDLIENFDEYEAGLEEDKRYGLKHFLSWYLWISYQKEIIVDGVEYTFSEGLDYNFAYPSDKPGKLATDHIQWGFISEGFIYYISVNAGKNKENYDAVTALIPKIKPVVISYEELIEGEVE